MTDVALDDLPPPQASSKREWGKALAALRRLLNDKEDTVAVFEIMRALNGSSNAKGYARLLKSARGGRIAYERVELGTLLSDGAYLNSLPAGSVGAGYRDFLLSHGFTPDGLAELSRVGAQPVSERHPLAWFGRRTRDAHDLWHVISGYETDGLGEACLVAFSYAQTGGLGWALIALGALQRSLRNGDRESARAILEGWRRGRRCAWLNGEDYEVLLREPLDAARARLGLTKPLAYLAVPPERRNPLQPR
jgi:ubiquinone biosynthesis protein COQ4